MKLFRYKWTEKVDKVNCPEMKKSRQNSPVMKNEKNGQNCPHKSKKKNGTNQKMESTKE